MGCLGAVKIEEKIRESMELEEEMKVLDKKPEEERWV